MLPIISAANVSRESEPAQRFGVHEIVLTGNGAAANPFDTEATVTFSAPEGGSTTVHAFYDGGNTWRARVYVTAAGDWRWRSAAPGDAGLDGKEGSFPAVAGPLRGMLKPHTDNPRQWMTDDGRTFLNFSDTAYYLFSDRALDGSPLTDATFRDYVTQAAAHNITSLRANVALLRDPEWASYFADASREKINFVSFQRTDARMEWMLNHYPDLYLQLILVPESNTGWKKDETFWAALPAATRTRLMKHLIARYAAWPQVFWLIGNDYAYGDKHPNNTAQAHEWGAYFAAHDPWGHLLSTGRNRHEPAPFPSAPWNTYLHLETAAALAAGQIDQHAEWPRHVFNGEDQYEYPAPKAERRPAPAAAGDPHQEPLPPARRLESDHARYFYRWLFWSWLLSGGSANYGTADWNHLKPYETTTYTGLDSVRHILPYFTERKIDPAQWTPDDARAWDAEGVTGDRKVQAMRHGTRELLVYHPNAARAGLAPVLKAGAATLRADLRGFPETLDAEWFRAHDGVVQPGGTVAGGGIVDLAAPWEGHDVVLHLKPR